MAYNKRSGKALFLILILSAYIMLSQIAVAQEASQQTEEAKDSAGNAIDTTDTANGSTIIISEEKQLSRLSPAYINGLKEKRRLMTNLILIAAALLLIYLIYRYKIEPYLRHKKEDAKGHSGFFGG